jgi:hypothetical protein
MVLKLVKDIDLTGCRAVAHLVGLNMFLNEGFVGDVIVDEVNAVVVGAEHLGGLEVFDVSEVGWVA